MYTRYTGIGIGHYAQYRPPMSLNHDINIPGIHCEPPVAVDEHIDDKCGPSTHNDGVKSAEEAPMDPNASEELDVGDYDDNEENPEDSELEEDAMDEDFGSEEDEYYDDNDNDGGPSGFQVKF